MNKIIKVCKHCHEETELVDQIVEMEKECECGNLIKRTQDTYYWELPDYCEKCVDKKSAPKSGEERTKYWEK